MALIIQEVYANYFRVSKILLLLLLLLLPPVALRPNAGHGLLILEVSRSHTTSHHSR